MKLENIDKKRLGLIILFTFIYLIIASLAITGVVFMALNYKQFEMYNILVKTWNEYSGASSPGFQDYLNQYNSSAASTTDWVKADVVNFSVGIVLAIISIIGLVLAIVFNKKAFVKKPYKNIILKK